MFATDWQTPVTCNDVIFNTCPKTSWFILGVFATVVKQRISGKVTGRGVESTNDAAADPYFEEPPFSPRSSRLPVVELAKIVRAAWTLTARYPVSHTRRARHDAYAAMIGELGHIDKSPLKSFAEDSDHLLCGR